MDFEKFNASLDESVKTLEDSGSLERIGFTPNQTRFINLLIARAIEKYDQSRSSKTE